MEEMIETDVGEAVAMPPREPEAAHEPADGGSLLEMLSSDSRVAHFIVDVMHGGSADEACMRYFPMPAVNTDSLVKEAEERGYVRGRNEVIKQQMDQPQVWQMPQTEQATASPQPEILAHLRRSVWD